MKKTRTRKCWKVMKICSAQLLLAVLFCSISIANTNYAQVLERPITIDLQNAALEDALHEIEFLAKVKFAFSADQFRGLPKVTYKAENTPLRTVLDAVLATRSIEYRVHEGESIITLKKTTHATQQSSKQAPKILEIFQVTGLVTDASSQPLPGVNIIIKGTLSGTTSDSEGRYTIQAKENDILVFSFIGYSTKEITVTSQTVVDIVLEEDVTNLDEVLINAGYYKTTKENQTGSIGRISTEEIQKQPVPNPLAAMQGRVPGLEIVQSTGLPGGNFQVRIRGQNSIASGNDPLYIVNGVPYISSSLSRPETTSEIYPDGKANPLNNINPQDIESIEVLKDADATAIYGSRGSNGVILITTKKGTKGKTSVDVNYREGTGKVAGKMDLLNTPQYLEMRNEAFQNDGITPDATNAPDLVVWDQNHYTDWQKALIGGSALYRDAQLSISGGENLTQFSVGAGYHKETTVFPGSYSDQRMSIHSTLNNVSPSGKLKTTMSFNYTLNNTDLPKVDLTYSSLLLAPNAPPPFKEDGELNWGPDSWNGVGNYANPFSYTKTEFESKTNTLLVNSTIGYSIIPDLEIKANLGYTNISVQSITTTPISSLNPLNAAYNQNSSAFANSSFRSWIAEPQFNWKRKVAAGTLNVLAGASFLEQITESISQYGLGFSSEALMKNLNAADEIIKASSVYTQYRYQAAFARVNYNLKDKYIFNFTGRRDGSSRFGPGKQFSNFGAVGGAWIFSKEGLIANALPVLSFGKLRGSFGTTGNDQIGDYQYLDTYSPKGSGQYNGNMGLAPQRLFNADFAWETVTKLEVALELGLAKDRVFTTIAAYRNKSSNQLVGRPLPPTTGFTSIQSNFPAMVRNTGIELGLTTIIVQSDKMNWTTSVNVTVPKNKLLEFPGLETSEYASLYQVGQPLSIAKSLHYDGVNSETGLYTFEDVNGDGLLNQTDRYVIQFKGRDFYGGVSNTIQFRNFQLDFLFDFVKQSASNYLTYFAPPGRSYYNQPLYVKDRWENPSDQSSIQKFSTSTDASTAYSNLQKSDRSVSDASFVRLKNISFSWSVPANWSQKISAQRINIFIQGQNLFTITKYKGLYPEYPAVALPPLRVITAGLNLQF